MPRFDCPACSGKDCVVASRRVGQWLITCHGPGCSDLNGGDWLRAVAEAVGAPGGGDIKADPSRWLNPASGNGVGSGPGPDSRGALPDVARFQGWASRLWSQESLAEQAREWLMEERLISEKVIRDRLLGWNGTEVAIPLRSSKGAVVTAKLRRPGPGHKTISWPGIGRDMFPLFPWPEAGWRSVVVCEGELDALAALSAGLPACGVTLGAGTWRDKWTDELSGRRVAVCFDVGAGNGADRVVYQLRQLRQGGASRACQVRLPGPRGFDVTDFLRQHSARELRALINEQWRQSRQRQEA